MTAIRPASPEDAPSILALHVAAIRAFGPEAYDDAQVDAWAEKDTPDEQYPIGEAGHYLVVAERTDDGDGDSDGDNVGSELVGYGHLLPERGEVRAVYVRPDAARGGVGFALLSHLEGYARGVGLDALDLWASLNAAGFYERAGYESNGTETVEKSVDGERVKLAVVSMEKSLDE